MIRRAYSATILSTVLLLQRYVIARFKLGHHVLFAINDGTGRVAKVHLTWSGRAKMPPWSTTKVFASIDNWAESMRLGPREYVEVRETSALPMDERPLQEGAEVRSGSMRFGEDDAIEAFGLLA